MAHMMTSSSFSTDDSGTFGPSTDVINSFVVDWVQIKYFYSEIASLAQELCETLLASNGIRAIVTHRVKQGNRLEAKLRERVRKQGKVYRTAADIRNDIVDLAGVRIALYFPSDREKIEKIINDAFTDIDYRVFPEEDDYRPKTPASSTISEGSFEFKQRFQGYSADHYRVRMKIENLSTKRLREDFQKSNPVIEIQVASVLMHAWAEIDHDLVYKTLTSGPASREERRLLDATNGLVHTGEVLLQQLQTAMDTRVSYQNKPFCDQYELRAFLKTQIKDSKGSMYHLDILLLVLRILDLNSPWKLGGKLESLAMPDSRAPITLTILEYVLSSLGEEQFGSETLALRRRPFAGNQSRLDRADGNYYVTDLETKDGILEQKDILERAVQIVDILRFPERSILVIEGMPSKFNEFYALHNFVHFATVRPRDRGHGDRKWLVEKAMKKVEPLWNWFEKNDDMLFRVAFLLARLNVPEIERRLVRLRPGHQRIASSYGTLRISEGDEEPVGERRRTEPYHYPSTSGIYRSRSDDPPRRQYPELPIRGYPLDTMSAPPLYQGEPSMPYDDPPRNPKNYYDPASARYPPGDTTSRQRGRGNFYSSLN